jgi:hypothetical protein
MGYPRADWWRQFLGTDWFNRSSDEPVVYDETYQSLLDYATSQGITLPDTETKLWGSQLMEDIKAEGFDLEKVAIYVLSANVEAREFCKLNWITPGTYTLTETELDSLGFSSLGFDGDSTNMLLTGFNPSSAANALFTQNNASVVCFVATNEQSTGLDWGAFDGTRQAKLNSRNASDQRAVHFNDGTNTNIADTDGSGWHVIFRNSAATKRSWNNGTQTDSAVTSTGLPNEQFAILGRRNAGANDFPSPRTIGYWSAGQAPSAAEIAAERRIFARYYIRAQKPLFEVSAVEGAPAMVLGITGDETAMIGGLRVGNTLFFSNSEEVNAGDVNEYEPINAFDLTNDYTGTRDVNNPLLSRATLSLGVDEGATIQHEWSDATYHYFTLTVYNSDDSLDVALVRAPLADEKDFSDHNFTRILTTGFANHAARFFQPEDQNKIGITYAHKPTSGDVFQINTATCDKSDLFGTWTVEDEDIIEHIDGLAQEYAKLWLEGSTWYMTYGEFGGFYGRTNFSMFATSSSDRSAFPVGKEVMPPSGVPNQFDENYRAYFHATEYPIPTTNVVMYFQGRQGTGNANYIGIGVMNIKKR